MIKLTKSDALEILGLEAKASEQDIKAAYRRLAKITHPDVNGSKGLFQLLDRAYNILTGKEQPDAGTSDVNDTPKTQTRTQSRPRSQEEDNATFVDLISRDDFLLSFKDMMAAAENGVVRIPFHGRNLIIKKYNLECLYFRSRWPAKLTCKFYKSWLDWQLDRNPVHEVNQDVELHNYYPYTERFERTFRMDTPTANAKYYTVILKLSELDLTLVDTNKLSRATITHPARIGYSIYEPMRLEVKCKFKFASYRD